MKRFPVVGALVLCAAVASAQEKTITVDFGKPAGTIRPLHDVHNGPLCKNGIDLTPYYQELGVRFVRIHDAPWTYADAVDTHIVFPDFAADADDPKSYHFEATDNYVKSLVDLGAEIIFRIGESAGKVKDPPADFAKWAKVGVNIMRHYNEGWAGGFTYGITYWEIWNEPDIKNFWSGTVEKYCELYEATSLALKAQNTNIKVGGPALAAWLPFLEKFLAHCRDKNLPLDFVSWHSYGVAPYFVARRADEVRAMVDKYGFASAETMLNEWNYFPGDWAKLHGVDDEYSRGIFARIHGVEGAAYAGGMLSFLQDTKLDVGNYYTGTTLFWGMFDDSGKPHKNFYTFRAFRSVLDTPARVATDGSDKDSFSVLAGLSQDKKSASVLISNLRGPTGPYKLVLKNTPWEGDATGRVYVLNEKHDLDEVDKPAVKAGEPLVIDAGRPSVCLVKINSELGKGGPLKKKAEVKGLDYSPTESEEDSDSK